MNTHGLSCAAMRNEDEPDIIVFLRAPFFHRGSNFWLCGSDTGSGIDHEGLGRLRAKVQDDNCLRAGPMERPRVNDARLARAHVARDMRVAMEQKVKRLACQQF